MALTVTVDRADYADGVPMEVHGLGLLKNREPFEVTEDQERNFARENKVTLADALKDNENYSVTGTALVSGDLTEVLGYDPDDVSSSIVPPVPQGDRSPATSMGETEQSQTVEVSEPEAPAPEPEAPQTKMSFLDATPAPLDRGGDS